MERSLPYFPLDKSKEKMVGIAEPQIPEGYTPIIETVF